MKCADWMPPISRKNMIGSERKPQIGHIAMMKPRQLSAAQTAAIGIAFGVTAVSTGLQNRRALYVALGIAGAGIALYYPMMTSLLNGMTLGLFVVYAVATVLVCGAVGWFLGGADRGPVVRTAALTGVLVAAGLVEAADGLQEVLHFQRLEDLDGHGRYLACYSRLAFMSWRG